MAFLRQDPKISRTALLATINSTLSRYRKIFSISNPGKFSVNQTREKTGADHLEEIAALAD
jgi:hypothetical protein